MKSQAKVIEIVYELLFHLNKTTTRALKLGQLEIKI